jgi:hypothetical protein
VFTQPHQHPVHRLLIALALTAALANQSPQAQTAPNAGSLQQQIERNKPAELLKVSAAAVIRRAFHIGVTQLSDTYSEPSGGKDVG